MVIDVTDRDDNLIGFETTLFPVEEVAEGPSSNNVTIEELHNVDPRLTVTITSVEHCPSGWFEVAQNPPTTGSVSKQMDRPTNCSAHLGLNPKHP